MKNYQFYHIYPLGMLNRLRHNDNTLSHYSKNTLGDIQKFIPHLKSLNINALLLGPIFESDSHGYDTTNYLKIDPRLGTEDETIQLVKACHNNGISVILDCVFNHVSRNHFAFQDCLNHQEHSMYKNWFHIDFSKHNHRNDPFTYDTWDGHDHLVKLNLSNEAVQNHLFQAIDFWIDTLKVDGLRMDAADVMDTGYLRHLVTYAKSKKNDFFFLGEMVHGDYNNLMKITGIDAITNYECYKGLYSSLNDHNYFEINYALRRLFSKNGLIQNGVLYNFVDNHDVNRIASQVNNPAHLYPLYIMLYTLKGYPSIYYSSELMVLGTRTNTSDHALRQPFNFEQLSTQLEHPLLKVIKHLSSIRADHPVLSIGNYTEISVNPQLIVYGIDNDNTSYIVIINSSNEKQILDNSNTPMKGYDLLNNEIITANTMTIIHPNWGRIILIDSKE